MTHGTTRWVRTALLGAALTGAPAVVGAQAQAQQYDVVVRGGRVIDPESGLDAVRNVGIRGGRIAYVGTRAIRGKQQVDATGLVVAPGFIDLHRHGHDSSSYRYQVLDGVTSALELEVGTGDIDAWYASMPRRLVNHGVSIGHIPVRMRVLGDSGQFLPSGPGASKVPDEAQRADMLRRLDVGLQRGAVGVGMGLAYTPAASAMEALQVYRVAARHKVPVYIHLRGGMSGLVEAIGDAAASGAPLHVVHVNSSGGQQVASFLEAIEGARARGLDVTTESYPYTAGSSRIESALYADWESWPDERFARLQWVATGERLTRETFRRYRAMGGTVISHGNTEEAVTAALRHPLTAIASDGGRVAEGVQSHPRAAGTYSRILGHYVREANALDLRTAIAKMTIMPARRLQARIPDMRDRGRIRVGAWADVTVFDPRTIIDRSTYTDGTRASEGVRHVFVNGVAVVRDGAVVDGVAPGRPIRAAIADTGRTAAAAPAPASGAASRGDTLVVGTYAYAANDRVAAVAPLAAHLAARLARPTRVASFADPVALARAVREGRADVAVTNTFGYLLLADGPAPAAMPVATFRIPSGTVTGYGSAIVTCDTTLRAVDDLAARARSLRVAFVAPGSTTGNLVPRLYLAAHGLGDVDSAARAVTYAGTHQAAYEMVMDGRADVAALAIEEYLRQLSASAGGTRRPHALWQSADITLGPVAVRAGLPDSLRAAIAAATVALEQQAPAAFQALRGGWVEARHADALVAASDATYDPVRRMFGEPARATALIARFAR